MIIFNRVNARPEDVSNGEEHISFHSSGAMYITDNEGHQVVMNAGTKVGEGIPTWTPNEANALYYNKSNGSHYISSDKTWFEIPRAVSGSEGGPTTMAGNVLLLDLNDYYVSTDVEGALQELAEGIPGFRTGGLPAFNGNVASVTDTTEYYVTNKASTPNHGDNVPGWLINRKGETKGESYGLYVSGGTNKNAYLKVNDKLVRIATEDDIVTTASNTSVLYDSIKRLEKARVGAGEGLTSNNLPLSEGTVISLSTNIITKINTIFNSIQNKPEEGGSELDAKYVSKAGDTVNGYLTLASASRYEDSRVQFSTSSSRLRGYLYLNRTTDNIGLWNSDEERYMWRGNMSSGELDLQSLKSAPIHMHAGGNMYLGSGAPISITARDSNTGMNLYSKGGGIRIGHNGRRGFIEAFPGKRDTAPSNIIVSGVEETTMDVFETRATFTYGRNAVVSGSSMHVGMDAFTQYGHLSRNDMINSLLLIYPYERNSESGAERNYARLGYSQKSGVLRVQSFKKNISKASMVDRTNNIGMEANFFRQTSSIKFKDVEKQISGEDAYKAVMKTTPYIYTFKNDTKPKREKHAGFIIEKGVPREAVSDDGMSIDTYGLIAYMYGAFQEHIKINDKKLKTLEERLTQLENK